MKKIAKILAVPILAMFLVAWTAPAEAVRGHNRFAHKTHYRGGKRGHGIRAYHHRYAGQRYYRHRHGYKLPHYRHGHYSHFGLFCSPRGTSIRIGFGF